MTWLSAGNPLTVIENSRHFFNTKVKGKSGIWFYSWFPLKLQLCLRSTTWRGFCLPWHQNLILRNLSHLFFRQGLILDVLVDNESEEDWTLICWVIPSEGGMNLLQSPSLRFQLLHYTWLLNPLFPSSPAPPLRNSECFQAWTWTSSCVSTEVSKHPPCITCMHSPWRSHLPQGISDASHKELAVNAGKALVTNREDAELVSFRAG